MHLTNEKRVCVGKVVGGIDLYNRGRHSYNSMQTHHDSDYVRPMATDFARRTGYERTTPTSSFIHATQNNYSPPPVTLTQTIGSPILAEKKGTMATHSLAASVFYSGNSRAVMGNQFSSNQLIPFDRHSPDPNDLDLAAAGLTPGALPQPAGRQQEIHRPHSLPLNHNQAAQAVPLFQASLESDTNVYNSRDSWYTRATNVISPETHFSLSRAGSLSANGRGHNLQYEHAIKQDCSGEDRIISPAASYSDTSGHTYQESPYTSPFKNERHLAESPEIICKVSPGDLSVPNGNSQMARLGVHPSNVVFSSNSQVNCTGLMQIDDARDIYSHPNSVDSGQIHENSNPYEDLDNSQTSNEPFVKRKILDQTSGTLHHPQHFADDDSYRRHTLSGSLSLSPLSTSSNSMGRSMSSLSSTAKDSTRSRKTDRANSSKPGVGEDDKSSGPKHKNGKQARGAQNLPPCRVCGNKASGLHFGVNTCEACNEFFRRSLKRGATYYCTKNRECQVYGKKRNACSYCRYHRCVEMGMSRDAIKTGRYSHKTRTEYAMEVEVCKKKELTRVEKEKYEILLNDLVKYHDKYIIVTTRVPEEDLYKKQSEYLQIFQTHKEHELRHPPLSSTMQTKGFVNGWCTDKEDLSLTMHDVEMTEKWLRNYINFAKNVPGFKELALCDQASLVRGSWFEFWFLGAFRGYNPRLNIVIYPNGRCFHQDEIKKVFGEEYTEFSFYLGDRMRTLNVTPEEMVLIKTVCLTFPDRTPLENKEAVDRMHWLMVSCLLHTLERNRPGDRAIFPLIVSKLVELRTLTDIAMRAHRRAVFQDVLKDSPLLCEMVDTKTRYVQCTLHKHSGNRNEAASS